jgi:hypothetical protein
VASINDIDINIRPLAPTAADIDTKAVTQSSGLSIETLDFDTISTRKSYDLARWFEGAGDKETCLTPAFRITLTPDSETPLTWDVELFEARYLYLHLETTVTNGDNTTGTIVATLETLA